MSGSRVLRLWGGGLILSAAALSLWLRSAPVRWENAAPANCIPRGCYCEADRGSPVRQPANTWSCWGFVLVGCWIIACPLRPGTRNPFLSEPGYAAAYGAVVWLLGVTSAWFHASLTFPGEWADGVSMHALASFMIAHNLRSGGLIGSGGFYAALAVLIIGNGLFLALSKVLRLELFGFLLAAIVATDVWARRRGAAVGDSPRWLLAAVGTFLAAYGIWLLDFHRLLCSPSSLLQGHAAWHALCSLAAGMLFWHYRTSGLRP